MAATTKRRWLLLLGALLGGALLFAVTVGFLTRSFVDSKVKPVREKVQADWRANQAGLLADLEATKAWDVGEGPSPEALGCRLSWTPDTRPSVKKHLERCGDQLVNVPQEVLDALRELDDELLTREAELKGELPSVAWMSELRGAGRWRWDTGTPWELEDANPWENSPLGWPLIAFQQVRALPKLRLVEGARARALEDAVADVEAYARALLGSPSLIGQLIGAAVLKDLRAMLDRSGHEALGPSAAEVEALRRSRRALGFLWNPWVPAEVRDALDAKAPVSAHCAAAWDHTLFSVELGVTLRERYAGHFAAFEQHRTTKGWCDSPLLDAVHAAPQPSEEEQFARLTRATDTGEEGDGGGLLAVMAQVSPSARAALGELMLSIATPTPFAAKH